MQALQTLQHSLCGCTTIDGSIIIDFSAAAATPDSTSAQLTASNFSFLEQVQEVTGYLELKGVRVADKLSLPSLTVIHGRELKNGRALVIDSVVAPAGVTFPMLSEIVTGDAYFNGVSGVCGYANVDWSDILSNGTLQEGNTSACVQGVWGGGVRVRCGVGGGVVCGQLCVEVWVACGIMSRCLRLLLVCL